MSYRLSKVYFRYNLLNVTSRDRFREEKERVISNFPVEYITGGR